MHKNKKVVLISFYDRISLGMRLLSSILNKAGYKPYLLIFKDDRSGVLDEFNPKAVYDRYISNNKFIGTGTDVNPPTKKEYDLLIEKIVEIKPDVVGVTARSIALDMSREVIGRIRKILPNARYIGGGYGPTLEPEKFLEFLDYICLGEGEKTIVNLVASPDPTKEKNIAWTVNGKLFHNELACPQNLDEIDYTDWDNDRKLLIDDDMIKPIEECFDLTTYDIFASRGCPNTCTYCMANHQGLMSKRFGLIMPKIRLRSPEATIKELKEVKEKKGIRYVRFKDSIFGFNKKWLFKFADLYDKHIGLPFTCYLEIKFIDEESIQRLKKSGFDRTTVGIQSANERIRREIMGRTATDDDLVEYADMLVKNGIKVQYDIIHFNPFDTAESLEQSMKFLKRFPKGGDCNIMELMFWPGSQITALYLKEKPKRLEFKEYLYYAWLFQMIMYSEKTEKSADFFVKYKCLKKHPRILEECFNEEIGKLETKYSIIAAKDIKKGDVLTRVMFDKDKTKNIGESVIWEDRDKLTSKVARKTIKRGMLVKWSDIFGTYEKKYDL